MATRRTIPKVLARDHNRIVIKLSLLAIPLSLFLWLVGRWLVYLLLLPCHARTDNYIWTWLIPMEWMVGQRPLSNSIQLVVLFTHTGRFTGKVESFLIYSKLLLFSSSPAIECVWVCGLNASASAAGCVTSPAMTALRNCVSIALLGNSYRYSNATQQRRSWGGGCGSVVGLWIVWSEFGGILKWINCSALWVVQGPCSVLNFDSMYNLHFFPQAITSSSCVVLCRVSFKFSGACHSSSRHDILWLCIHYEIIF